MKEPGNRYKREEYVAAVEGLLPTFAIDSLSGSRAYSEKETTPLCSFLQDTPKRLPVILLLKMQRQSSGIWLIAGLHNLSAALISHST